MSASSAATILVVDDNAAHRYATGRFLRAAGFAVREAATGQEALRQARLLPDVIVLDVNLPDIDGFEVCRTLRREAATARIPVIHLSATFLGTTDYVHGLNAGADGYLTHPVEPAVLVATVSAFVRARATEELYRRSEQRFRDIFEHVISGIAVVDGDDTLLEINPAMCRMLGHSRDGLVGRCLRDFLLPAWLGSGHASGGSLGTAGSAILTSADGTRVDFEWQRVANEGRREGFVVAIDVTGRRILEQAREASLARERAARTEAEKANRIKDQFLATVSHELRSPLNAIVGWSHILNLKAAACPDEVRKGIDAIDRNAKLQSRLISDLLDVSRATSGKLSIAKERVALWPVIELARADALAAARARGISLDARHDGSNPELLGDPVRLQQVVSNLLNNAIKFSPADGTVRVELSMVGARTAAVRVIDTGRGIAPEFLPHIFDTFRQEDAATNRAHEGMGLGLAIVKQLAELHGGNVTVASDGPGTGATFTLRLPILAEQPMPEDARCLWSGFGAEQRPTDDLAGLQVLYVDDDEDARAMLGRLLEDRRVRVTLAASATEALNQLRHITPDLIISDIGMPKQDGYAFMQQVVSEFEGHQRPRAIALTAFGQAEDRRRALSSGYDAHLSKPIEPVELFATISRLLPDREAAPTMQRPDV